MLPRVLRGLAIVAMAASPSAAHAQGALTATADVLFYGDNTEFRNPFREGETLFGAAVRLGGTIDVSDRVRLRLGVFGNQRFGSDDAFEQVRPVIALEIAGRGSTFTLGTLPPPIAGRPAGPDRTGPHGLLPPMQRETLAFERPYEAGMMWSLDSRRLKHQLWIDWQRLNTEAHRERFDAGATGSVALARGVALPFQFHVVHEGGQQFASGPVADSLAAAIGLALERSRGGYDASLELYALGSRFVPDREEPERSLSGAAFLGRAAVTRARWRAHLAMWRGDDFVKEEGDPNYMSVRRDGTRWRGVRDYAEAGLTRTFEPAPGILLEMSGRLHRVEKHYEYSYRVLAVVALRWSASARPSPTARSRPKDDADRQRPEPKPGAFFQ